MAAPGDEIAAGAGGHGRLRASHADREQVIGTLKAAFVQGMLAKDEFDARVSQAFASRTYAELAALTADIPAGLIAAQSPTTASAPSRKPVNKKVVAWAACLLILGPAVGAAFLTFYGGFVVMFVFALIGATATAAPPREGV